jgi:hypothetical protein
MVAGVEEDMFGCNVVLDGPFVVIPIVWSPGPMDEPSKRAVKARGKLVDERVNDLLNRPVWSLAENGRTCSLLYPRMRKQ